MTTKKELEGFIRVLEEERDCAENDAMTADAELGDMIAMLKKHGDHIRQCQITQQGSYYMEPVECDCGWAEIEREYF